MTYEEEMKISTDFFDTIDFKRFIKPGERIELQDLENSIDEYYDNHRELLPEVFQGYVFNFVTDYELGQYLKKRYGWEIHKQAIEIHYFIIAKGDTVTGTVKNESYRQVAGKLTD